MRHGNRFAIRAKAKQFRLACSATDSGGLSGEDSVTVDQDATQLMDEAELETSEDPIRID